MPKPEFLCPVCGTALSYHVQSKTWDCPFCLSSFERPPENSRQEQKTQPAENEPNIPVLSDTDKPPESCCADVPSDPRYAGRIAELFGASWQEKDISGQVTAYRCSHCGEEFFFPTSSVLEKFCPVCHGKLETAAPAESFTPQKIAPFQTSREDAVRVFRKACRKNLLLPFGFAAKNAKHIQGFYLPYWIHSMEIGVKSAYNSQTTTVSQEKQKIYETVEQYQTVQEHRVLLEALALPACKLVGNSTAMGIGPYPPESFRDVSADFPKDHPMLPFQIDEKASLTTASQLAKSAAIRQVQTSLSPTENPEHFSAHAFILRSSSHPVLVPVWYLHAKHRNKPFIFLMNGVTGQNCCPLPQSISKALASGLAAAVCAAGIAFFLLGGWPR